MTLSLDKFRMPRMDARSPWIYALGVTLGAFLIFAVFLNLLNNGVPVWWSDSYEYAQVARNFAEGRGLVTSSPHVLEAWILQGHPLPLPYFFHDPGQALVLGLYIKVLGASDATVGWMSGSFYILIPAVVYFFARRVFGAQVAVLAALLAVANNQLVSFGLTGLSEIPYAFFLTCCLYSLYRQRKRWHVLVSGLLFGWLAVMRSNSLPFLPWVALFIALDPPEQLAVGVIDRIRQLAHSPRAQFVRVALFVLGFLLVFTPNAIRNYSLIRNPLYNAASVYSLVFYTSAIDGKSSNVYSLPGLDVQPLKYLATNPDQLVNKMEYQLSRTLQQLYEGGIDSNFNGIDAILIALLLIGAVLPRRDQNARQTALRRLVYLCIATGLVVGSMTFLRWRHMYGFVPVVLILDAELILAGLRALQARVNRQSARPVPIVLTGAVLAVLLLGALGLWAATRATLIGDPENQDYRGVARWLAQNTPDDALILAEQGDASFGIENALAWYARRELVEYHDFTATTIPAKRGSAPLYLLFVSTNTKTRNAILSTPALRGYVEIARLNRNSLPNAILYSSPTALREP